MLTKNRTVLLKALLNLMAPVWQFCSRDTSSPTTCLEGGNGTEPYILSLGRATHAGSPLLWSSWSLLELPYMEISRKQLVPGRPKGWARGGSRSYLGLAGEKQEL